MIFCPTSLRDVFLIEPEPHTDERGFSIDLFSARTFETQGLEPGLTHRYAFYNRKSGTLRGMTYQEEPHEQVKLVRCTSGAVYDVVVDLREDSSTFGRWYGTELSARNHKQLYIPVGFAHGYLTLMDDSEVDQQMSVGWHPESERGVRWDDPLLAIAWPFPPAVISPRDRALPAWEPPTDSP